MFPARIYIGQIVAVFAIVVAANWGASQWTASALGYQQALGAPWFTVASYPVYPPWRLFEWWYAFEAYAPHVFERAGAMAAGGGVVGAFFAVLNSQGPVAKIVAVIIITVTGLSLAFGDTSGGFRKMVQVVFGLSAAAILIGTLAAVLALGLRLWIAGLVFWIVGHGLAVWLAKRDPAFVEVGARHLKHRGWLAC
jgi:type IV secretory pathway TrbD component